MRAAFVVLVLVAAGACGIKGAPRPPLDEPTPVARPLVDVPDAGCCEAKR